MTAYNNNTDLKKRELSGEDMVKGIGRKATDEELMDYLSMDTDDKIRLDEAFVTNNISNHSFHDSMLLQVKEFPGNQTIEFLIDFPIDWDNNIFEHHLLRFTDVISYKIDEIPFSGGITILNIEDVGEIRHSFGSGDNAIEIKRNKIEIITNAGKRAIEYYAFEMIRVD